jgi:hypothetical protein
MEIKFKDGHHLYIPYSDKIFVSKLLTQMIHACHGYLSMKMFKDFAIMMPKHLTVFVSISAVKKLKSTQHFENN